MYSDLEDDRNTLYIPRNIVTRFEFISGFGMRELGVTAIFTVIALIVAVIFTKTTGAEVYQGVFIVLITATTVIMATRKNEHNMSFIDIVKLFFNFAGTQQKFGYRYYDPYERKRE